MDQSRPSSPVPPVWSLSNFPPPDVDIFETELVKTFPPGLYGPVAYAMLASQLKMIALQQEMQRDLALQLENVERGAMPEEGYVEKFEERLVECEAECHVFEREMRKMIASQPAEKCDERLVDIEACTHFFLEQSRKMMVSQSPSIVSASLRYPASLQNSPSNQNVRI